MLSGLFLSRSLILFLLISHTDRKIHAIIQLS
jgi:hypothetical protein